MTSKITHGTNGTDASSENLLYHVKCEIIDSHSHSSGAPRETKIFGTFTALSRAKAAARHCLKSWGYLPDDFQVYEENRDSETWNHGDGVALYAKAPAGQEFTVRLDTKPNLANLKGDEEGVVQGDLHYVVQTTIFYEKDRTGASQSSEVEGVYLSRKEAVEAAYTVLLDKELGLTREQYAEYDEENEQKDDWPYGDDVLVHAVGLNGENYLIEVKVPSTNKR